MRLRFILDVSIKQLLNNFKSTFVIILSLTVCIASVFLMAEALLYSNTFIQDIEVNRRTYYIESAGAKEDCANTYKVYEELMDNDYLPEISYFTGIHANPGVQINVEVYIDAVIYREGDSRYSVELDLIAGRGFTEEEIREGSNVVIISDILNYGSEEELQVGDEVLINNTPYEIIGIDKNESYITEQNVVKSQSFFICFDQIVFSESLSEDEELALVQLLETANATPESRFSQLIAEFAMHVVTYVILIGLVSYCAFSIIAQLFNFMVKSRNYEYNIYKVLGIRQSLLFALYYTPILGVFVLSGVLGILIYRYSEPLQSYIEMEDVLSFDICLVCYVIVAVVLLLATMPNYLKLRRQSAIETR